MKSLADLRPGDLMFANIGGIVPGVFPVKLGQLMLGERVRLGPLSIDHVGVVVEGAKSLYREGSGWNHRRLVQAMPGGAEEIELNSQRHWTPQVAYARLPEDYPGQALDAAAIARAMIGTPYSFASYAALAAWRWGFRAEHLARWIDRRRPEQVADKPTGVATAVALPAEAICSVLADQAWTLAGKQVMPHGTRSQIVTPGALALALWRTPGVTWGGAGLL